MSKKVVLANIIVTVIIFILFGTIGFQIVESFGNDQATRQGLEDRVKLLEAKVEGLEFELANLQERLDQADLNYMYGMATAYHPPSGGINADHNPEVTSIGEPAVEGVIAVDPEVIPYGSEVMIIAGNTVVRGKALDTGGDMRRNPRHVDILMDCIDRANEWGVKEGVHILWW